MTNLDLTKLRETAVAATPGPWNLHTLRTDETHDIRGSIDDEANIVIYAECEDADAAHVATFDPPTVLALIARLEAAEAKVEQVRGQAMSSGETPTPCEHPPEDIIVHPHGWEIYHGWYCLRCGARMTTQRGVWVGYFISPDGDEVANQREDAE